MVPWARAVHSGLYKRVVAVTAAQSGKTDSILDVIGARLDQRPAPILYAGPTKDFLTDQFEPRLMALFDEADSLRDKVIRGRRMKKTLKHVAGVRVRLAHAGSSAALKSDPAALALVDEYDEMAANIKGQGDALGLIEARGITYADFVTAITSTPSQGMVETEFDQESGLEFWKVSEPDDVASPIWKLWQQGTRYHWAWPCLHCDEYFIPRFTMLKWPKNSTPSQAKRESYIACPHCGGVLTDHEHKKQMNARGVYVAPGQKVTKDGIVQGDPPESDTFSIWVSGLASPFVSWGERASKYLTAYISGDQSQVQTAINANFGELYTLSSSGSVHEWQEIMERRLPYRRGELPNGVLRLVMGVDVQKLSLLYTIRGFGARGSSWLIDWGQLYGHTDDDQVWSDLTDLMLTPVAGMQIEKVFIDSGFRPNKPDSGDEHKVYELARRFSWLVVPTKGKDVQSPPYRISKIEVKPDGKKALYSINLAWLSSDFFKSLIMSRLRTPMELPGAFYVPNDIDEDYCRQIVSEVRTVNRETGKPEWVRRSRSNHFLDCEALCAAAAYTLNVQRIPEGLTRGEPPSDPASDPDRVSPLVAPPAAAAPAPTLRSRFAGLSNSLNR
jgi:phage terminase large subunit GpA-like protein